MSIDWSWTDRFEDVHVAFVGKNAHAGRFDTVPAILEPLLPAGTTPAWLKQEHGRDVVVATRGGHIGSGDAVLSELATIAPVVRTADCVPVLLTGQTRDGHRGIAAVHAGWRGVVARVVEAAVERFTAIDQVWVGPSISGDVYEVSHEVAEQVVAASDEKVLHPGRGDRPHVDLVDATHVQLQALGIERITFLPFCTHQDEDKLYSYRRDGKGCGHNVAVIWRSGN
ncbi:MAG: polyphenol oxidase family protein [Acidobacteriota bacterium]